MNSLVQNQAGSTHMNTQYVATVCEGRNNNTSMATLRAPTHLTLRIRAIEFIFSYREK
jgi:hypothetical protein